MFLDHLLNNASSDVNMSLNGHSIDIKDTHSIDISKQGLNDRYTPEASQFLKSILQSLCVKLPESIDNGWFESFNSIRIKDSTKFVLPETFADRMKGFGGVSSKSAACIQYEYDLKSGSIHDINITPANRNDGTDANETKNNIAPNDLVLRDLGYFSLDVFSKFINNQAFIISKVNTRATVFELKQGGDVPVDFAKLYKTMKEQKVQQAEMEVFVGSKAKIPFRLIVDIVPDEVYNKRMREINKYNRRKGLNTSEDYVNRARFNLIITNISKEKVPLKPILGLYRLRWQIELVFKSWKSTFGVHKVGKMKYYRWLSVLYSKLILIVTYWHLIMPLRAKLYKTKGRLLSIDKSFKTLKRTTGKLREAINNADITFEQYVESVTQIIKEKHWLEKKKNKVNYEQIMYLYYCKSDVYVYV